MASPLTPRTVPFCTACLRRYAFAPFFDAAAPVSALGQQVRGKKKMVNNSRTVAVRLIKDVKTYGQKGAIVPLVRAQMRNIWFPRRLASYITGPELKTLRLQRTPIERNFSYGLEEQDVLAPPTEGIPQTDTDSAPSKPTRSSQKAPPVAKVTPQRSIELLDIFVPSRLDFYRQPILEDAKKKEEEEAERRRRLPGLAAELAAAREVQLRQPIYGSVQLLDVLDIIRAHLASNDEARLVVLQESEVEFVDLPSTAEGSDAQRLKHMGEFTVAIRLKGADSEVRRTVRVVQPAAADQ